MTTNRTPPWNDQEIDAVIALYFAMCKQVDNGADDNNVQLIRVAQGKDPERKVTLPFGAGQLSTRSRQSIEFKLMNVTACLIHLNYAGTTMEQYGYKPIGNYQKALKTAVAKLIDV